MEQALFVKITINTTPTFMQLCAIKWNSIWWPYCQGHTPTLTTVDLIIMEIKDVEMLRVYDEETDLTQFLPQK